MAFGLDDLAILATIASTVNSMYGGGEQEMPIQYPQLNFMPQQAPQTAPFQPMGLQQPPQYGQQPAITQFPQFQPLFPRRRMGQ